MAERSTGGSPVFWQIAGGPLALRSTQSLRQIPQPAELLDESRHTIEAHQQHQDVAEHGEDVSGSRRRDRKSVV